MNKQYYGTKHIDGYTVDFYNAENGELIYSVWGDKYSFRTAKLYLYEWAKHLHGNAPSGTPYQYCSIKLPNGKRYRQVFYV